MGLLPRSCSSLLSGAGTQDPWVFTHVGWGKVQGRQAYCSAAKIMIFFSLFQRSSFAMNRTHIQKTECFCRDWPLTRCLGPFLELALKIEQDIQKPSLWVQSSWRCLGRTKVCRENRGQGGCSFSLSDKRGFLPSWARRVTDGSSCHRRLFEALQMHQGPQRKKILLASLSPFHSRSD